MLGRPLLPSFLGALPVLLVLAMPAPPPRTPAGPAPSGDGLDELRERLADDSARTRRSAVREAARRGEREAWELVLRALGDPESEVADAAQLALGELRDSALVDELFGRAGLRSEDEWVRRRAAEALGRVGVPVDARALAGRLNQRDERARRLLVWSVERLARADRLRGDRPRLVRALAKLQRSRRDPGLAADALLALEALGAEELPRLAANARTGSAEELRCAALRVAVEAPLDQREAWCRALAADAVASVRIQAVECLDRLGTRAAAAVLVDRIESERSEAVRWRVLEALQSVSGRKYRFDPRPWRRWLEERPEGWLAGPRAPGSRGNRDQGGGTRVAGLSTLEVRGERVCFLFDFSGSMWEELPDGRTPKDVVDVELRAALECLPSETEFNLIPYSHHPHPWQDEVVPASKRNVRAALEFFEGCRLRGRGNVWDALVLAMADPAVDTIVVLTDGYPTGGRHADMDLVAPLFEHANRYRKVTLDAILVDANHRAARIWSDLARGAGGTCLEVALRR